MTGQSAPVRALLCWSALTLLTAAVLGSSAAAQRTTRAVAWGRFTGNSAWNEESFVKVVGGVRYTAALRADGTIAAWGNSEYGECHVPALPAGLTYTDVAAGREHVVALRSDGTAIAWGRNFYGQCNVPPAPAGTTYTAVAAGGGHSVGLLSNGRVLCWGSNSTFQLVPPGLPPGITFVAIAASNDQSIALCNDGSVRAWGAIVNVPAFPAGVTAVMVAAGLAFDGVILSDGTIVEWGLNNYGQLTAPAPPSQMQFVDLALSDGHAVAVRSDGMVFAWGHDDKGQVSGVSTLPPGFYVGVGCGPGHSYARRADGKLFSWGTNEHWQRNIPSPPLGRTYEEIRSTGYSQSVAGVGLLDDGTIVNWGRIEPPTALPPGMTYTHLGGCTNTQVTALRSDGAAVVWGSLYGPSGAHLPLPGTAYVDVDSASLGAGALRDDGQIDVFNSPNSHLAPAPTLPAGLTYVQLSLGTNHGLARRSDGSMVAWGYEVYGELSILPLPPGLSWVHVGAGYMASTSLRSDGLFHNTGLFPVNCAPPGNIVSLDAGWDHYIVGYADKTFAACGSNAYFQLETPSIPTDHRWKQIRAGDQVTTGVAESVTGVPYCVAKVNSLGCPPSIGATGVMSATLPAGYVLRAVNVRNQKAGMLLYTNHGRATLPFGGGTLCVAAPLRRGPGLLSGGSPLPASDCTGVYSLDVNAFRAGTIPGNPAGFLSTPGTVVDGQYWGRDPGFTPPNDITLSNAMEFVVQP